MEKNVVYLLIVIIYWVYFGTREGKAINVEVNELLEDKSSLRRMLGDSGISNCYLLNSGCETFSKIFIIGWVCLGNERKLRDDRSLKICIDGVTKNIKRTDPTYKDCSQIALMSPTAKTGEDYYIIQPTGSRNVITKCQFDGTHNTAFTMIYYTDTRQDDNATKTFYDIGVYYTRIKFEGDDFKMQYHMLFENYQGFPPHIAALKFGGIYYFGSSCPDNQRAGLSCDVSDIASTIPIADYAMTNFHSTCGDDQGLCPEKLEVHLPMPNVKLTGISDIDTLRDDGRRHNNVYYYKFRFYGQYEIPDLKFPIYSSTNTITFGGTYIYIYIYLLFII